MSDTTTRGFHIYPRVVVRNKTKGEIQMDGRYATGKKKYSSRVLHVLAVLICLAIIGGVIGMMHLNAKAATSYTISGTWKFNVAIPNPTNNNWDGYENGGNAQHLWIETKLHYTSNGESFDGFYLLISNYSSNLLMYYNYNAAMKNVAQTSAVGTSWYISDAVTSENSPYRIVDFGTEPQAVSEGFYKWFVANAVPNRAYITYNTNGGSISSTAMAAGYSVDDSGFITNQGDYWFHRINSGKTGTPYSANTFGLTRPGYTFKGWRVYSTNQVLNTSTAYDSTVYADAGDKNKTSANTEAVYSQLFAVWEPETYKIYFAANGGSGAPAAITRTYGKNVTFPTAVPTKPGYTFAGWRWYSTGNQSSSATSSETSASYAAGQTAYASASSSNICWDKTDCTYVAIWKPNTIKLTLNVNGGSGGTTTVYFKYGTNKYYSDSGCTTQITAISRPSRPGYAFKGYAGDSTSGGSNGERYIAYDSTEFASDLCTDIYKDATLYAKWEPLTYKIYFGANGGSGAPAAIERTCGENVTFPTTVPTRAGYTFVGWLWYANGDKSSSATSSETAATYTAGQTVYASASSSNICWHTTDCTYVAIWRPNTIKLTLNTNGGSGGTSVIYFKYGINKFYTDSSCTSEITAITRPTKTGYKFVHYYGDGSSGGSNGERYVAYDGTEFASDLCTDIYKDATLYAKWEPVTCKIYFGANGGSGAPAAIERTYGENVIFPTTVPTRAGYTFVGWLWYANGDKSSSATSSETAATYTAGQTVYASASSSNICWHTTDCTYVAIWVSNTVQNNNKVWIAYYANGGTVSASGYKLENGFVSNGTTAWLECITHGTTNDPYNAATFGLTREGYTFKGWRVYSTNKILDENVAYDSTVYADVNDATKTTLNTEQVYCYLYAEWEPNWYNQTNNFYYYHPNNGWTWFTSKTTAAQYGSTFVCTTDGITTPVGYHWGQFNLASWVVTGEKNDGDGNGHYYANEITVRFNLNYGSGSTATQTFAYNASGNQFGYNTDGSLTWGNSGQFGQWDRAGYTLLGWSHDPNATSAQYPVYCGVSDEWLAQYAHGQIVDLYAVWQGSATYKIHYCDNVNLVYNHNDIGVVTNDRMWYQIENGVISVAARDNDGYGFTTGRVYLEAGKTYYFSCITDGTWGSGSGSDTVEAFLMHEGSTGYYKHLSQNGMAFTVDKTGTYWIRLDVNQKGKLHTFKEFRIVAGGTQAISGTTESSSHVCGTVKELTTNAYIRLGYTFCGWNTRPDGTGTWYNDKAAVVDLVTQNSGSITLYAQWTVNSFYLDVNGLLDGTSNVGTDGYGTFDVYINGTLVADDVCDYYAEWPYGTSYEIKDIKQAAGHSYLGVSAGEISGTIGAGQVNVRLKFVTNKVWIAYYANGGTVSASGYKLENGFVSNGTTAWLECITHGTTNDPYNAATFGLTREGYVFKGWRVYSTNEVLDENVAYDSTVYADVNDATKTTLNTEQVYCYLYAVWEPINYTNYIYHWMWGFNGEGNNGGNNNAFALGVSNLIVPCGSTTKFTTADAVRIPNGFYLATTFGSSSFDGNWQGYPMGTTFTQPAGSVSAEYDYYPYSYAIRYELNGGTNSSQNPDTYSVLYGVTFAAPTKPGCVFDGWYINGVKVSGINVGANASFSNVDDMYSQLSTRTTGDITVEARWVPVDIEITNIELMRFNEQGKLVPATSSRRIPYGSTIYVYHTYTNNSGTTVSFNGYHGTTKVSVNGSTTLTLDAGKSMRVFVGTFEPAIGNVTLTGAVYLDGMAYGDTSIEADVVNNKIIRRYEVMFDLELTRVYFTDANGREIDTSRVLTGVEVFVHHVYVNRSAGAISVSGYHNGVICTQIENMPGWSTQDVVVARFTPTEAGNYTYTGAIYRQNMTGETERYESNLSNNSYSISFTTVNAPELTPVVTGVGIRADQVTISSFTLSNDSDMDFDPYDPLKATFSVYNAAGVIVEQMQRDVIVPANETQLVWFRWTAPTQKGNYKVVVTIEHSSYSVPVSMFEQSCKVTENGPVFSTDTKYEPTAPSDWKRPMSAVKNNSATWSVWEYRNDNFEKVNYGISVTAGSALITPVSSTAYQKYGTWYMKSGYGFTIKATAPTIESLDGYLMADIADYTEAQHTYVAFPEFGYRSDEISSLEFVNGEWVFAEQGSYGRQHFTPIWYPDSVGTEDMYFAKLIQTDIWTPAGIITVSAPTSGIYIEGDLYDDWYT